MGVVDAIGRKQVDEALRTWRQGDCVVGDHWFLSRIQPGSPLTAEGVVADEAEVELAEAGVRGLMVATQTCDIIRTCTDRPFVEVCPLVELAEDRFEEIRRGRRPNYAYVPGVAEQRLVADLDRVMTVEKAVVASWTRVAGCSDDEDARNLARALARKRQRFAFPDDFAHLVSKLRDRLLEKHDKQSDEGRALRALREIRVRAAPSWHADQVTLTFWFVREDDEPRFEGKGWAAYLEAWLARVPAKGRFVSVDGLVQTLDDLTARDYVESDPLDLDHLTKRET